MSAKDKKEIDDFAVGSLVQGTVMEFTPFGAYVDIEGVRAKLNREEISWCQIGSADHFLIVGQEIKCVVVAAEGSEDKFIVSMKLAVPNPWSCNKQMPAHDDVVSGRVISVYDRGMIVELANGFHGKVELRSRDVRSGKIEPTKQFAKDGIYTFAVVKVNPEKGLVKLWPEIDKTADLPVT